MTLGPDVSPDGAGLTYGGLRLRLWDLGNARGRPHKRLLVRHPSRILAHPRFSPDGNSIIYTSFEAGETVRGHRLHTARLNGSGRANGSCLDVDCALAEPMGAELIAHFALGRAARGGELGAQETLTARLNPLSTARAGDRLRLADVDRLHFFDAETERAIDEPRGRDQSSRLPIAGQATVLDPREMPLLSRVDVHAAAPEGVDPSPPSRDVE